MNKQKVVIIGAGEIGRAMIGILSKNKNFILEQWSRKSGSSRGQKPISEAVAGADFVLLCIPSWAIREVAVSIKNYLKKGAVVITFAKGLEQKTNKAMDEVLDEELSKNQPYALIGGPMIAEEIAAGKLGMGFAAVSEKKIFGKIRSLFEKSNIRIGYCADMRAVALCGVLKNIYAIALGMADALELGENFKGWMAQQAVYEMSGILEILGSEKEMVFLAGGFADLMATGYSKNSRNRQVGDDLVKTGKCCLESEGYISFSGVSVLLKNKMKRFPIFSALHSVIEKAEEASAVFNDL